jgi:uncharacterized protein YegL
MIFGQAWALWLLPLLAGFAFWQLRRGLSSVRVGLFSAGLAAAVLAVADPKLIVNETRMAVAVLVDSSLSAGEQRTQASRVASAIASARGRNDVKIIPFDRTPREARAKELDAGLLDGASRPGTDLEAALSYAMATFPAGKVPRIALISDGQETSRSAARAGWQARQLGIPVDTFPLPGLANSRLRLDRVSLPPVAYAGERFPVELLIESPQAAPALVQVLVEGKPLGRSETQLAAGLNRVPLQISVAVPGALELTARVESALGSATRTLALHLRKARMLLVSQDPPGADDFLRAILEANQIQVAVSPQLPLDLSGYELVALNNLDLEALPAFEKDRLERYATDGGGLLVIGGDKNLYREGKKEEDALERALPAKLAPPKSPEGTVVVLILDKSSSMEGRKMDLARTAGIGLIDSLRPQDFIGVLIFDNSFSWAVPIRKAEDKLMIKRLVAGVTPDGGTQIAPALSEAYRRTVPAKGLYKHIILLTDGISEEGDSLQLAKDASDRKITISTVGLGQDVNRAYLEKVAGLAKGKSYFLVDPSGLEQILIKDVKEHTGGTAIERDLKPLVAAKDSPVLEGVPIEEAPALKGYVRFDPKPTAEILLKLDEKDPLYSRWQIGLGRSAVFASDAKNRWAQDWITWNGFSRFWSNAVQDLLPRTQPVESRAELDPSSGQLVVTYRHRTLADDPGVPPPLFALGPDGFQQPVALARVAPGSYRGAVALGGRTGMFRVRPLVESNRFPETGAYVEDEELRRIGNDERLLRQIAAFTGGQFNPQPTAVFSDSRSGAEKVLSLWPALLGLAIALNVGEVAVRKLRGYRLRAQPA